MAGPAPGPTATPPGIGARLGRLGIMLFPALLLFLVAFGPLVTPFSATAFDPAATLRPPGPTYLLGTDEFGRDLFSRIVAGAQPTLLPALASTFIGILFGTATGLAAGFLGGRRDEVIMRAMDVLLSFPALILAMLIIATLGANMVTLVFAIGFVFWPRSARLIRSAAMELARHEFVDAARARGEGTAYIMFREILPNMWGIIVVDFTLRFASAVLLVASLSYLGIGVSPPTPAWGLLVKEGQPLLQLAPWVVIFPCIVIAVVSVGSVMFGEVIRRRLTLPDRRILA
ncbi:MAG: ABC transporter permease [Rhodobacteraceae bacterium]|nr:ABC transporter permease [Paracoccaceae bacterium]